MNKLREYLSLLRSSLNLSARFQSTKFYIVLGLTASLSVILNGKTRCFSVLAAELQNQTCNTIKDTCGMATLNWIAFLSEMIIVGGNPFITNMLFRVHSGVLGGRITFQFCMILTLGIMLTGFVGDPESLFVTDTIIQGVSTSVLLSLVTFKIGHLFPESHPQYRSALLLTEIVPWIGVVFCPMYGLLVNIYGWQSTYFLIALLILMVCLIAGAIEPKCNMLKLDENDAVSISSVEKEDYHKSTNSDNWEICEDGESECQHPRLMQLLLNANVTEIVSRSVVVVWFVERALVMIAEFNLIINLVHYMTSVLMESISKASIIMITLGLGNIIGYTTIFILGIQIKVHLTKIYMVSSVLLVISFIVWQSYGSVTDLEIFTVFDAHCVVIVIGVFSAMTSAQSYYVAEDVIERPRIISVSLTKLAQAVGLLIGPITSGMLIQLNFFHSFFITQAFIHSVRIMMLAFITFKTSQYSKIATES